MNKRITSIVLSLVMLFTMLATAVPVLAATPVELKVTADTTSANPGDTINYSVSVGAVTDMGGLEFKLDIPSGLTIDDSSISIPDGLETIIDSDGPIIVPTRSNKYYWLYSAQLTGYTGTSDLVILTFSCKVDDGTTGTKTVSIKEVVLIDQSVDDMPFNVTGADVNVTAAPVAVTGVTIDETLSVNIGQTKTPSFTVAPAEATNKTVSFTSDNPAVATVNATTGEVTGVKKGTATITVKTADGNFTDTCTVTVSCAHTNKSTVPAKDSTCTEKGWDEYKECDDCGQLFDTSDVEIDEIPYRNLADHTPAQTATAEYLKSAATCTSAAVYYEHCSVCDVKLSTTFTSGSTVPHTYDQEIATAEYKVSDATCTTPATYHKSCICGAKGTETFESGEVNASNHTGTLSGWQTDSSKHWKEYSCCHVKVEEGTHDYTDDADTICDTCGYERTITPSHTHSWATAWSKNDTHHWHECTGEGTCDVTENSDKDGYAAHTYDQEIAAADYKVSDATCTAKATYYKSCVCGAKGTETFESGEVNASNHTGTLSGWQTDSSKHWKEYSCCHVKVEEGTHDYTDDADTICDTCGYERTITPSHTHSWATAWSKNDTHHWHECTGEGTCDVTENSDKDGYAAHTYDQEIAAADYKVSDATCTTPATYYKSCICGATGTETFESGEVNASNHTGTLSGWQTDSSKHWKEYSCCHVKVEEGTHDYTDDTDTTCNTCDYERTVAHEHTFGAWSDEVPATCKTTGTKGHKDCTGCNKHFDADGNEITDLTIPVDPANHTGTLGGWVKTDPDKHWKEYSCCHVKVEEGTHVYTDDADTTCNTCGYIRTISAAAHTVTVNGSYAVNSGAGSYDEGDTVTIHAGSRSGYTFDGWTSDDVTIANASNKNASFVMPDDDVTVTAHWTRNAVPVTPTEPSTYTIKVEKTDNGDVTVSHKSASKGTTVTITVEPDEGYTLETLTVTDKNGDEIRVKEKNGKYTFTMPASKVYVEATFMEDNSMLNFFVDVPADAYYYDAVLWAAKNGITGGVDDTHFAPNATCTRAQAVTFLWRAAGSPAAKSGAMPFADVKAGSYYYDAVLWAVENGITKGTSDTTFSPDVTCSRAQIVTFLWRANGSPAVSGNSAFTDVAADAYYAAAVTWAEKNDVTGGIGGGLFGSNNNCTRAQIVTFIYRSVK